MRLGGNGHRWCGPQELTVLQDDRSANNFILQVDVVVIFLTDGEEEFGNVVGVESGCLGWQTAREISQANVYYVL